MSTVGPLPTSSAATSDGLSSWSIHQAVQGSFISVWNFRDFINTFAVFRRRAMPPSLLPQPAHCLGLPSSSGASEDHKWGEKVRLARHLMRSRRLVCPLVCHLLR